MHSTGEARECGAFGECFVCMDDGEPAPKSPCACRGRYLHVVCQLHMAKQSGHGQCSVCKTPYTNLMIELHKNVRLSVSAKLILSSLTVSLAFLVGAFVSLASFLVGHTSLVVRVLNVACGTIGFGLGTVALCKAHKEWRVARRELGVATWMWTTHTCVVPSILELC